MSFTEEFVWGTATSSYQIEGAHDADGKGKNIWDVFTREENRVVNGEHGDTACNHYNLYKEDVRLMKEMGIKAYRFSLNWARILPEGTGKINQAGIDFYNKLIDELLKNDIEPYITMYHWELPLALLERGGFYNDDFAEWFSDYARVVAENFSDRVKYFITFNEPQIFIGYGFGSGQHAPGHQESPEKIFRMIHNVLKAHGSAVKTLRKYGKHELKIGIAPTAAFHYPQTESEKDIEAARKMTMRISPELPELLMSVTWYSDPIFFGKYPEEGLKLYKEYLPEITEDDMELISQPIDFLGQNIYNGHEVRMNEENEAEFIKRKVGYSTTALKWPITPKSLYYGPKFLYERYQKPIYITENGLACNDLISLDGQVHDPNRIDFLHRYLSELKRAVTDGIDVKGYFLWSFMDNFEWHSGYSERFGIVYVDFEDYRRIRKDSSYWYEKVIESNGELL